MVMNLLCSHATWQHSLLFRLWFIPLLRLFTHRWNCVIMQPRNTWERLKLSTHDDKQWWKPLHESTNLIRVIFSLSRANKGSTFRSYPVHCSWAARRPCGGKIGKHFKGQRRRRRSSKVIFHRFHFSHRSFLFVSSKAIFERNKKFN